MNLSTFSLGCWIAIVGSTLGSVLVAPLVQAQDVGTRRVKISDHRDLAYVAGGHERQKLDLFLPEEIDKPRPVIIWIHGGGWLAGSKDGCPPLSQGFVQRGYAVASIGYRLSSDANFPAQIEDCKAAVRWLRAHAKEYQLDVDHFAAWGSSAGGHLATLLGTSGDAKQFDVGDNLEQSSRVQAVCDYYGPTDLLQMDAHALVGAALKHDAPDSPEAKLIGGPIQENVDKAKLANPIVYVDKNCPPFLIVHGDQDPLVPHHQSELLFEALKSAGISARFHTITGAGHGKGFGGPELDKLVNDFFERTLKDSHNSKPTAVATSSPAVIAAAQDVPGIAWRAVRNREDTDQDGRVTRDEFKGPPRLFDRLDRNRDGELTEEDFEMQDTKRK